MRALLPIAILSVLGVAAASAAGCSASVTLTPVTPPGKTFPGPGGGAIDFGASCSGTVYYADGSGWAYCVGGVWDYTTTDPSGDGYTIWTGGGSTGAEGGGSTGEGGGSTGEGGGSTGGEGGGSTGEGGGSTGGEGGGSTGGEAGGG